ncbi:hypothetical protein [Shewanella salipaludis]|uniref:Porin n=1 Tax=Shewanella salipaludis TaxID=2723052 RepID=A0A972JIZ9_9GAMM|nr:hypothetical protein [Shewanella salipaludis]NMH64595.1 hypothetical protein [Shewanella salipaludis]
MKYLLIAALLLFVPWVFAEPYLAVQTGFTCSMCHTNPSGGGKRTEFGNQYAQQLLPAQPLASQKSVWSGNVTDHLSIGGNARLAGRQLDLEDRDDNLDFDVRRVTLYLNANLTEEISLYIDQRVAPGGAENREVWAKFNWGNWYGKAGRLFLPFGWRIEDDSAFVREVTGINFNAGDTGVEVGYALGRFNWQLAATNGNGGASEVDDDKLFSTRAEWVEPSWRAGLSALNNKTKFGERSIYGLFAGLKTGRINWLLEYDHIEDNGFSIQDLNQDVALIEANILLRQGHHLKLTFEALTADKDTKDRFRGSIVYEYFPWAFSQFRAGFRKRDSDDDAAALNSRETFVEIHVFF